MPSHLGKRVEERAFSAEAQKTWTVLFDRLAECRAKMTVPEFTDGVEYLGLNGNEFPNLESVNDRLSRRTGWKAIPVEGLESFDSFYPLLAAKCYPIGWFMRDALDINYTPAPDIFHDLYGHMPFFADPDFANFCASFGEKATKYLDSPEIIAQFDRLFWFTAEFGLIETPVGRRIFGGGILSSFGESYYALSDKPRLLPFDLQVIRNTSYRVDTFQKTLFVLPNRETLYGCLDKFERLVIGP